MGRGPHRVRAGLRKDPSAPGRTTEVCELPNSLNPFEMRLTPAVHSITSSLHDSDLFLRQPIQLVHQRVDLAVGDLELAFRQDQELPESLSSALRLTGLLLR